MNLKQATKIIIYYQSWRLGKECEMPNPNTITEALETFIKAVDTFKKRDIDNMLKLTKKLNKSCLERGFKFEIFETELKRLNELKKKIKPSVLPSNYNY